MESMVGMAKREPSRTSKIVFFYVMEHYQVDVTSTCLNPDTVTGRILQLF
jgi:hypothetical protein